MLTFIMKNFIVSGTPLAIILLYIRSLECISTRENKTHKMIQTYLATFLQNNRFLPVCVLLCIFKFSDLANTFPHPGNGQGNGFSPVCTLIWFTSLYLALKGLPALGQDSQKQAWLDISGPPTWSTVKCVTISCRELKVLVQDFPSWSGSSHWQVTSCFTGCLIYLGIQVLKILQGDLIYRHYYFYTLRNFANDFTLCDLYKSLKTCPENRFNEYKRVSVEPPRRS